MYRAISIALTGFLLVAVGRAEGPAFEVVSVKISGSGGYPSRITGGPGTNDPGRFHASHVPMATLLKRAFGIDSDQITGPAWLWDSSSTLYYDITATMSADTTKDQLQKMLQNVLAGRFHLVYHRARGTFPAYALVVDKGGTKLRELTSTPGLRIMGRGRGPDGFRAITGPTIITNMSNGRERTKYQEQTMEEFVSSLGPVIGGSMGKSVTQGFAQPRVFDRTGLTGRYTFILEYSSELPASIRTATGWPQGGSTAPKAVADFVGDGTPNIFTAIQKQLGLRLDKTAGVPLEVIVVDSVDKNPTEN